MDPSGYPNASSSRTFPIQGSLAVGSGGGEQKPNDDGHQRKKQLHRDLERQRRQQMAGLRASLRTLLPHKYIKGKRAASDQIDGAVNFIKDTQEGIKQKTVRRDELMREVASSSNSNNANGSSNMNPASVLVQTGSDCVEVLVSSPVAGFDALPVSLVLEVLREQGLEVICCLSTRVNQRLMHTMKVEVKYLASFNIAWLQQKLNETLSMIG